MTIEDLDKISSESAKKILEEMEEFTGAKLSPEIEKQLRNNIEEVIFNEIIKVM